MALVQGLLFVVGYKKSKENANLLVQSSDKQQPESPKIELVYRSFFKPSLCLSPHLQFGIDLFAS
jgi:hypothetical protein